MVHLFSSECNLFSRASTLCALENITRFAIQNGLTTGVLHPLFLRGVGAALAHKKNWLEIREKCTHVELLKFFPEEIDGRVGGNFYKLDLTQKASVAYICNDFGAQFIS